MNVFRLAALTLATALSSLNSSAQTVATSPFLETCTLTFNWGYNLTYITSTESNPPTYSGNAVFDPNQLTEDDIITTDIGTVQPYTGKLSGTLSGIGNQKFFVDRILQKLVREGTINKEVLSYRWQFTAVRNAPRTIAELTTNPYTIYLTLIDPVPAGRLVVPVAVPPFGEEVMTDDLLAEFDAGGPGEPLPFINTGITITLGKSNGTFTERNFVSSTSSFAAATGSVSTAFTIDFGARFYEDPRHEKEEPGEIPERNEYHLVRNLWQSNASGLINYKLRSIAGPLPAFAATSVSGTATGWFVHQRSVIEVEEQEGVFELELQNIGVDTYGSSGVSLLRVRLGNVTYQKRERFPDFATPLPPLAP
jgi:hypothetical protein